MYILKLQPQLSRIVLSVKDDYWFTLSVVFMHVCVGERKYLSRIKIQQSIDHFVRFYQFTHIGHRFHWYAEPNTEPKMC